MTVQIKVEKLNGKVLEFGVAIDDTIKLIKLNIQAEEGIDCACQCLTFGEEILEDENTLAYYNIQNESTLHLVVEQTLTWMLVYADGCQEDQKAIPWTVKRSDWIDNIEQKILEKITDFDDLGEGYEGLLDTGLNLFFCKEQIDLHYESQVGDYNMDDNEIIAVNGHNDGYGRFELFCEEPNEVDDDMMMGLRAKCLG